MLLNMKELLAVANEHNFAVPAFNIGTGQILNAVVECCEEMQAPVILAIHPLELKFQGDNFIESVKYIATRSKVPCVIHLDHSGEQDIYRAVRCGFTSVMIDASHEAFEDNIALSKKIADFCHPLGVSVEAELGTIGTCGNDKEGGTGEIIYTKPEDVKTFVEATGVDCLAIAIGTAHGIYPKGFKPHLKLDLLSDIKKISPVPLVLHGGSSNKDEEIATAARTGVNKINISSDIKDPFYRKCREVLRDEAIREPNMIYPPCIKVMKEAVYGKVRLFKAGDTAKLYY